jgi:pSer/pThr/pTyr-binding forkhead associated (FHA) protein
MTVFLDPVSGKGLKIPVDKAIIFIGRHPDCDVVITRSRMISRKHCALVQINDTLVIRDLGSTNGIRVNGEKVRKEAQVKPGDTVTIGDLDYVMKSIKAPEPERRANREHHQDARSAGSTPLRVESSGRVAPEYSQEIPVAIPDEEFEEVVDDSTSDTPDSFPVISERERGKPADPELSPGRSTRLPRRVSDSDVHLPLTD